MGSANYPSNVVYRITIKFAYKSKWHKWFCPVFHFNIGMWVCLFEFVRWTLSVETTPQKLARSLLTVIIGGFRPTECERYTYSRIFCIHSNANMCLHLYRCVPIYLYRQVYIPINYHCVRVYVCTIFIRWCRVCVVNLRTKSIYKIFGILSFVVVRWLSPDCPFDFMSARDLQEASSMVFTFFALKMACEQRLADRQRAFNSIRTKRESNYLGLAIMGPIWDDNYGNDIYNYI